MREASILRSCSAHEWGRRKAVKDIIGRHINEGNKIFVNEGNKIFGHPAIKQGDAMKEATELWVTTAHYFINASLGSGEAKLFLSDAGYAFFSSNGEVGNWRALQVIFPIPQVSPTWLNFWLRYEGKLARGFGGVFIIGE